jgi:hypothetical protein
MIFIRFTRPPKILFCTFIERAKKMVQKEIEKFPLFENEIKKQSIFTIACNLFNSVQKHHQTRRTNEARYYFAVRKFLFLSGKKNELLQEYYRQKYPCTAIYYYLFFCVKRGEK